jgi:hypothetical protein
MSRMQEVGGRASGTRPRIRKGERRGGMSGWYRYGAPGEDTIVHINTGSRSSGQRCASPRFAKDDPKIGRICGRMSVALCDWPGCDKPMCELHCTKHATKPNTDFCPEHTKGAAA